MARLNADVIYMANGDADVAATVAEFRVHLETYARNYNALRAESLIDREVETAEQVAKAVEGLIAAMLYKHAMPELEEEGAEYIESTRKSLVEAVGRMVTTGVER